MEERRWNDDLMLTDKASRDDLERALTDGRNRAVALHKPGSTVTMGDGTEYLVGPDGAWRRITPQEG